MHIFSFLDPVSLLRASTVCRMWREVGTDDSLWRRLAHTHNLELAELVGPLACSRLYHFACNAATELAIATATAGSGEQNSLEFRCSLLADQKETYNLTTSEDTLCTCSPPCAASRSGEDAAGMGGGASVSPSAGPGPGPEVSPSQSHPLGNSSTLPTLPTSTTSTTMPSTTLLPHTQSQSQSDARHKSTTRPRRLHLCRSLCRAPQNGAMQAACLRAQHTSPFREAFMRYLRAQRNWFTANGVVPEVTSLLSCTFTFSHFAYAHIPPAYDLFPLSPTH